jgi:hypothetical protein
MEPMRQTMAERVMRGRGIATVFECLWCEVLTSRIVKSPLDRLTKPLPCLDGWSSSKLQRPLIFWRLCKGGEMDSCRMQTSNSAANHINSVNNVLSCYSAEEISIIRYGDVTLTIKRLVLVSILLENRPSENRPFGFSAQEPIEVDQHQFGDTGL